MPKDFLPDKKVPADINRIDKWVETAAANSDAGIIRSGDNHSLKTYLLSMEMYLYGGLIASRISNDTTEEILERWKKLKKVQKPKMLASSVVMRIPAYNGDEEEPWYWEFYGRGQSSKRLKSKIFRLEIFGHVA